MKIAGKKVKNPNIVIIILPRQDGNDLVFKAGPVQSFEQFDAAYPMPKPPQVIGPSGSKFFNFEDKLYIAQVALRNKARTNWMVLESLKLTESLEWETVDPSKPDTWGNFEQELKEVGLAETEITRIINGVLTANSLDESKVEAARESFLLRQREALEKSSSSQGEPTNTESGEPANG